MDAMEAENNAKKKISIDHKVACFCFDFVPFCTPTRGERKQKVPCEKRWNVPEHLPWL